MFGGFPQRIDPFAGETWTGIATSSKMSRRPRTASDARIVTRRALDRWYSVAAGSTCTPVPLIRRGYRRRCRLLCAVPILLGYVCPASAGRGQSIIGCRSPEKWRQDPIRLATPLAAADRCLPRSIARPSRGPGRSGWFEAIRPRHLTRAVAYMPWSEWLFFTLPRLGSRVRIPSSTHRRPLQVRGPFGGL